MTKDAIILAAGIGSRLRPITNLKPKCMTKVAGIPILIHQINAYKKAGISNIFIVIGYEGEKVKEAVKHVRNVNIVLIENNEYETTNNMYSLYLVLKESKLYTKPFILSNGDVIFEECIIKEVVINEEQDLIVCDKGSYNEESMKVTVTTEGIINNISKLIKREEAYGNSIDIYKFSKKSSNLLFNLIKKIIEKENNLKDWTEIALQRLMFEKKWMPKPFNINRKKWVEIDNYDDLALADKMFSKIYSKLSNKKVFFIDLDGTIYLGNKLIEKSSEVIKLLRKRRKDFYFLSNNSSKSKSDYVNKLNTFGIKVKKEHIILSTDGLINFLLENKVKRIYTIGTRSLKKQLREVNIDPESDEPEYIVLGYDTELTYDKLKKASIYIQKGIDYIATHCDIVCPTENGNIPDIGCLIKILEMTTNKSPLKIFGKPNPEMISHIIKDKNYNLNEIVIIGDRLYTDMILAKKMGIDFILVLSGETKREQVEELDEFPELIISKISELCEIL